MIKQLNHLLYNDKTLCHRFAVPILILVFLSFNAIIKGQSDSYSVKKERFCSSIYDEFSPFFFNNGLLYCSNSPNNSLVEYVQQDRVLFNMYFVAYKENHKWGEAHLFSEMLTTKYNDGPAIISSNRNTVFFSRNIYVGGKRKETNYSGNKIGIFTAEIKDGEWANITAYKYNSSEYSLVSPSLSNDGKRLYFSSDMPGGFGKYDIYYSEWVNNEWQKPVNVGPIVNTASDETHPFITNSEKLSFASEGHHGLGGRDIFYTQQVNGQWLCPVHLDAEINSTSDDLGLFTTDDFQTGYFSSNRKHSDDIYHFKRNVVEFDRCKEQEKNDLCFVFYDEQVMINDSASVTYEWDFGGGDKLFGEKVEHCFPGAGKYSVVLRVVMSETGDTINNPYPYIFELEDKEQAFIHSKATGFVGDNMYFDALKTNLPGFKVNEYLWDIGEGFNKSGAAIHHVFEKEGEYLIKLGLKGEEDELGRISNHCVYKKIIIRNKSLKTSVKSID